MEVFIEEDVAAEVRVVTQLAVRSVKRAANLFVASEDVDEPLCQLFGELIEAEFTS